MKKVQTRFAGLPFIVSQIVMAAVVLQMVMPLPLLGDNMGDKQVSEKQKTIEIQAKGKTSDEISDEIRQKLIEEGFSDPKVDVTRSEDSTIKINLNLSDSAMENATQGILELKISVDAETFEMPVMDKAPGKLDIDVEGKTDEEVKALIEEKLAKAGKEGAEVKVTTTQEGKREIKIEIKEEKQIGN